MTLIRDASCWKRKACMVHVCLTFESLIIAITVKDDIDFCDGIEIGK